jgi:hypothetical protein
VYAASIWSGSQFTKQKNRNQDTGLKKIGVCYDPIEMSPGGILGYKKGGLLRRKEKGKKVFEVLLLFWYHETSFAQGVP